MQRLLLCVQWCISVQEWVVSFIVPTLSISNIQSTKKHKMIQAIVTKWNFTEE